LLSNDPLTFTSAAQRFRHQGSDRLGNAEDEDLLGHFQNTPDRSLLGFRCPFFLVDYDHPLIRLPSKSAAQRVRHQGPDRAEDAGDEDGREDRVRGTGRGEGGDSVGAQVSGGH
jgi:hypothetical protein